jgi:DNA-binding transcriptional MerR regulator
MIHARKTGKRIVLAAERDAKALQLRIEGYSLEQIKDALDYGSISEVSTIISKRLRERLTPPTEELRELERSRADHTESLAHRYMQKFDDEGRLSAADAAALIRIASTSQERRAKLLGLDAPQKIEQSGSITAYGSAGMIQAIQLIVQSGGELPPAAREFLETAGRVNQIPNELHDVVKNLLNPGLTPGETGDKPEPAPDRPGLQYRTVQDKTKQHNNASGGLLSPENQKPQTPPPDNPHHENPRTETWQDSTRSSEGDR